MLTCCTACADSSKNHIDDIAGSEIENENHIDDIAETETESENPSQVEASEEEQIDEEEYNLDEYAELDILEEKFENSDGDVVMTMAVSHLTFTDPKYEKVNAALESIEEAYMEETRSYCKEQAPEMELDMSIENENCRVEEYQWYFCRADGISYTTHGGQEQFFIDFCGHYPGMALKQLESVDAVLYLACGIFYRKVCDRINQFLSLLRVLVEELLGLGEC